MERACLVLVLAVAAAVLARPEKQKHSNFNLEPLLANDRFLNRALKCVTEDVSCPAGVAELKEFLPDAMQHDCAGCPENYKAPSRMVLTFLIEKRPHLFDKLEEKFDPEGIYRKRHAEEGAKT